MYVDIDLPVSTTFVNSYDANGIVSGFGDGGFMGGSVRRSLYAIGFCGNPEYGFRYDRSPRELIFSTLSICLH